MNFRSYIFLAILIVFSCFVSILVARFLQVEIWDLQGNGFQYIIFSLLLSFVYFTHKNLRKTDILLVIIGFTLIYIFLLNKSEFRLRLGGLLPLGIYIFVLFSTISMIFIKLWFLSSNKLAALSFSILAAIDYSFVYAILYLFLKIQLSGQAILNNFMLAFPMFISIGVAFHLAELIMAKLDKAFFEEPSDRIQSDDENDQ